MFELRTVNSSPFYFLPPEVPSRDMGTVGYTVGIDVHEAAISFNAGVNKSLITPGNARVGDENIKPATEVFKGSCDSFVHLTVGGDIDFVRLAY